MTAPTPRIESSMWTSLEMAIGDVPHEVPAFPQGYDPSKPFAPAGPPPGAFTLRPQEVAGSSVANPQASIGMYMQNRGGDVVIQPSWKPAAIRLGDTNSNFSETVSAIQKQPATAIIGGNPDNPVYFPRLPGKSEFNVSVEALSADDDLDKKLAAQSRFMSLGLIDHQDTLQEAQNAIARFDQVRQRSAAILTSKFQESGFGRSSPIGFARLDSPGPPEDYNRRESFDISGRTWNELGQEDLIELM